MPWRIKPAIFTTEFWITVVIVGVVIGTTIHSLRAGQHSAAAATTAIGALASTAYTVIRSLLKRESHQGLPDILGLIAAACKRPDTSTPAPITASIPVVPGWPQDFPPLQSLTISRRLARTNPKTGAEEWIVAFSRKPMSAVPASPVPTVVAENPLIVAGEQAIENAASSPLKTATDALAAKLPFLSPAGVASLEALATQGLVTILTVGGDFINSKFGSVLGKL